MGGAIFNKPQAKKQERGSIRNMSMRLLPKKEIIRREPLITADQILSSDEAKARLSFILEKNPPGMIKRWEKMLTSVNQNLEPTDEDLDPIRIQIDMIQLKLVLNKIFQDITVAIADENVILRAIIPELYKKHTLERGQRISGYERDEKKLINSNYSYGEIFIEDFILIFEKIIKSYGQYKNGYFCDLGCGVGQLVYSASIIGQFKTCAGIEILEKLIERGEKRKKQWLNITAKDFIPSRIKNMEFLWIHDDFYTRKEWFNATFILLHWSAFSTVDRKKLSLQMDRCAEGTFCITVTHPLQNPAFEILASSFIKVSWGETEYFVHEKMTSNR